MKEKNTTNITDFSQRSLEQMTHPDHALDTQKKDTWTWDASLEERLKDFGSDKILTLKYSNPAIHDFDSLFLETIARLTEGKDLSFLTRMNYREIENYLRDENHLPAFAPSLEEAAQASFKRVKSSLLGELVLKKIDLNNPLFDGYISWEHLSLAEKNRRMQALIAELNKAFPQGKKLELAFVESETVFLVKNDFPLDLEVVEFIVLGVFKTDDSKTCLKVVAAL